MKWFFVQPDFMLPDWRTVVLKLFKSKIVVETYIPCMSLGKGKRQRYTPYLDKTTLLIEKEGN